MVLWFITIAILGLIQIIKNPVILSAFNPYYGYSFLADHEVCGFLILSCVCLSVTGAEALYADLGHFGIRAIRLSWHLFVFPALALNYLGQGALLLSDPSAIENPFFLLAHEAMISPLIIVSTLATIIASQAVISGVFSISWQAMQLGYLPRMRVIHTSRDSIGQIYIPAINVILFILVVLTIIIFKSSYNLAAAYGISVAGTMCITTILTSLVAFYNWKYSKLKLFAIFIPLLMVDFFLFTSNLSKILKGGWITILIALSVYLIISTWRKGRKIFLDQKSSLTQDFGRFIEKVRKDYNPKIPGTGIFLSSFPGRVPIVLTTYMKHNKFLFERMIFLSVIIENTPRVKRKFEVKKLCDDFYQIIAYYGFMEEPNLENLIIEAKNKGLDIDISDVSFFVSQYIPIEDKLHYLHGWQSDLFMFLFKNSSSQIANFKIPDDLVVEFGTRFRI